MFNLWWSKKKELVKKKDVNKREPWKVEGFNNSRWYTEPDQTITVRIIQVPKPDIKKYCHGGGACHKIIGGMHTIYIPRLYTDNDFIDQQKLGHEMQHALGMKH